MNVITSEVAQAIKETRQSISLQDELRIIKRNDIRTSKITYIKLLLIPAT